MTENELKKCLEVYERQVVKEYDDVELEKVKLPNGFKKCTLDKVLYERSNKKIVRVKKSKVLKPLVAAVLICVILIGLFASSDISADIFGFDAWEMTYSKQDKSDNIYVEYKKNKQSKGNGGDKTKRRTSKVPQYVPKGFEYMSGNLDYEFKVYAKWSKGKKSIYFNANKISEDIIYFAGKNVEGRKVNIAGYVGYIYKIKNEKIKLQWNDDEYINTIKTDDSMNYSELLKVAESMYS